jgi:hypothetical protein
MDLIQTESEAYYRAVSTRILPWLAGRPVSVGWPAPTRLQRQESGSPIRIDDEPALSDWVGQGVVGFHVAPVSYDGEVWFQIHLRAGSAPFYVARLTALKMHLVLEDTRLDALKYYDGAGGVGFLWTYGVADPGGFSPDIWTFQHHVAARIHSRLEARLLGTPERDRIGRWRGYSGEVTRLEYPRIYKQGSASGGQPRVSAGDSGMERSPAEDGRIVLSARAMTGDGLIRVPYSLHEETGRAARPVSRGDLFRFDPERDGLPDRARRLRRRFEVPLNFPRAVAEALEI